VSEFLSTLRERVTSGTAIVGIYGLGYIGLPLALRFSEVGILKLLQEKGALIEYCDPHAPIFPKKCDYNFDLNSVTLDAEGITCYDCIVLARDHDAFDYPLLRSHARPLIDIRGKLAGATNVIPA